MENGQPPVVSELNVDFDNPRTIAIGLSHRRNCILNRQLRILAGIRPDPMVANGDWMHLKLQEILGRAASVLSIVVMFITCECGGPAKRQSHSRRTDAC